MNGNFGNMNLNKMMQQAQKMQAEMLKIQEEVAARTVEAAVGGGMVKVTASGGGEITSVKIDPAAADPEDVEMLQDMVLAAVNEALRRGKDMMAQEMGKLTGGLGLPGMNLPGF